MGLAREGGESEGFLLGQTVAQHSQLRTEKQNTHKRTKTFLRHYLNCSLDFKRQFVHHASPCLSCVFSLNKAAVSLHLRFKVMFEARRPKVLQFSS